MGPATATSPETLAHGGLGKRLFAWVLSKGCAKYDRAVEERKRALISPLGGTVLEIGPGTGPNLQFLSKGVRYIGVEPNPYMHKYLRQSAAELGLDVDVRLGTAERLPMPDHTVDAVIATLVLCSVGDVQRVLSEIKRVLKPGGKFVFIEHVAAAPGTGTGRWQNLWSPMHRRLCDGCNLTRHTGEWIEQAGFSSVGLERFTAPIPLAGPHVSGVAVR